MPEKKPDAILTVTGCGTCARGKKNGMCKDNKCVDIASKEGQKIAKQTKATLFPEVICHNKKGKPVKCGKKVLEDTMRKYRMV